MVTDFHLLCNNFELLSVGMLTDSALDTMPSKGVAREEVRGSWVGVRQASSGSLRLYAGDNLRTADRSTLKKAALDGQFGFAGAFCSARGPGIACISPEGILKVP